MPPGRPPVVGAEAGKKSMQTWFDRFDVQIEFTSKDVLVSGDLALKARWVVPLS
jgi:ketosteroid isomerase-like protein